jgi:hypothetical protein
MKKLIIFVFDDINQTPPQIRALIDCDYFGEVVTKRTSLAEESKSIGTNLKAQRFVHLKSAQDRTQLMDELLTTVVEQNTIIHCDSAISIIDHPAAMQIWFVQPFDFEVFDDVASYKMERLKLPDVSVLWTHGAINHSQCDALLNKLSLFLAKRAEKNVDKADVAATFDELYLTKVKTHHDQLKQWPLYNKFDKLIAGGTEFDSINEVYEKYYQLLNKVRGSLLKYAKQRKVVGHGDPCFSNILYDKQTGLLRLIDPKGAMNEPEIWTDFFMISPNYPIRFWGIMTTSIKVFALLIRGIEILREVE